MGVAAEPSWVGRERRGGTRKRRRREGEERARKKGKEGGEERVERGGKEGGREGEERERRGGAEGERGERKRGGGREEERTISTQWLVLTIRPHNSSSPVCNQLCKTELVLNV